MGAGRRIFDEWWGGRMWKKVALTYSKILSQNFTGEAEESRDEPQCSRYPGRKSKPSQEC